MVCEWLSGFVRPIRSSGRAFAVDERPRKLTPITQRGLPAEKIGSYFYDGFPFDWPQERNREPSCHVFRPFF